MYGKGKLFITALLGIVLLVGVAGADEFWEPAGFFAPSASPSPGTQTVTPITEFAFFMPGQSTVAPASQVPAEIPVVWGATTGGFIAPVFTGTFASTFIGPDPLSHPEVYEPIATGGLWATSSTGEVSSSWDKWLSKPASPRSCSG